MRSWLTGTVSRCSRTVGPPYQSMCADGSTTLSPASAEIGIAVISGTPRDAAYAVNSSAIAANTGSA
ncbi:hypothetical protein GA0115255_110857 [Streptomyces sp. Ncost-T6T-2b]|nr:hypothetical protein GA0115255_110857 [Streptomyces sp. Ncost-T6T-2b]